MYDKLLTVDSIVLETALSPEEFREVIQLKFGLRKPGIKNIFSAGGRRGYAGEITDDSFKVTQGNPKDPGFFFFTRIMGKYSEQSGRTRVEIKAQYADTIYYGFPASILIWSFFSLAFAWEVLLIGLTFSAFIGMYGKIQIRNDYDTFKSDLSFYTGTSSVSSDETVYE